MRVALFHDAQELGPHRTGDAHDCDSEVFQFLVPLSQLQLRSFSLMTPAKSQAQNVFQAYHKARPLHNLTDAAQHPRHVAVAAQGVVA